MKESEDRLAQGGTRWRRFAAMMVPATAVAGAIVFGMANGAIAASFAVSGQTFKVGASKLEGDGFKQYGGFVKEKDGTVHPVAVSEIANAELYDLCQSVKVPEMPIVLTINAGGGGKPATAEGLLIDMDSLGGDAELQEHQDRPGRHRPELRGHPQVLRAERRPRHDHRSRAGGPLHQRRDLHPQRAEAEGQHGRGRQGVLLSHPRGPWRASSPGLGPAP